MTGEWPALCSQPSVAKVSPLDALEPARTPAGGGHGAIELAGAAIAALF